MMTTVMTKVKFTELARPVETTATNFTISGNTISATVLFAALSVALLD